MIIEQQRDENLLIVAATEIYADKYNMPTAKAFSLFCENGINDLIRKHYNTLHTQSLDESFLFAEDVLQRKLHGK
jgi:hypothetical protein